jgi:hypothetical protein
MGIMSNKVTRRVALGSIAGGLAGTVAVLSALKGKYRVDMPDGASVNGSRKLTIYVGGTPTTIELPAGRVDKKTLETIIEEHIKHDPKLQEAKAMSFKKWKEQDLEARMAQLDKREKEQLDSVASSTLGEQEKKELVELVKKSTFASREKARHHMDSIAH